ncbi:hypothetical protein BRADI_1g28670v3 [Brachypodium distachyon]|uniref:RRM domain-containing protein n=1 Tax=Brachypodium distachyon TaxID=15368 RepID=A0A0Q3H1B3_BRADI|nr:hypothetical protein BRADI_1g28670v3 [Brachypodium distachyon]
MGDPPPAPRRPLFDLNVAVDEFEEEFEEEPQEMEQVVEVREVVEEEEEEVEEEEPQEMIMEEDEEEAEAAAEAAQEEEEDAIVEKEVVEEAGMMAEAGEDEGRRKKRKEYEVFVFGLPPEAVEENVAGALAEAGEVEEVRLVRDPAEPQLNKGFAFVRFAEVWQARWAADDLRTAKIKGKACGICKNNDNETLHLRNICFDWSKDDLAENLKTFELENLEDINLIEHPDRKGKNRGYAFLDFSSHVDAVAGFLKLQKRDLYLGTDIKAQISFSNTISQDDKVMEKVKSVFLDGLPPHWDEDDVREKFGKFGEIDNIQLARNMFTAKRKDFGFISFTTRQAAIDCIDMVNKGRFGEGSGKVRMKATLQRPKPTFKKPSWQGDTHMLGVRRGFIGKSHGDREPYPNRFRHLGHERRAYSNNFAHGNYRHQPMVGRSPPMAVDDGERPVSLREYRSYYRRDSAVPAINMEGHIQVPELGRDMMKVDMLANIQNISMQHMKHPCKEMNTGVNMDIHTWKGHTANLAQNAFEVIITPVLIRMVGTPVVTKLVTVISARMVKNFLQPVDLRRLSIRQTMSPRLQRLKEHLSARKPIVRTLSRCLQVLLLCVIVANATRSRRQQRLQALKARSLELILILKSPLIVGLLNLIMTSGALCLMSMRWSTQSGNGEAGIYLQETGTVLTPGNTLGKEDRVPKFSQDRSAPVVRLCYILEFGLEH